MIDITIPYIVFLTPNIGSKNPHIGVTYSQVMNICSISLDRFPSRSYNLAIGKANRCSDKKGDNADDKKENRQKRG